jgi:hypothetical protein
MPFRIRQQHDHERAQVYQLLIRTGPDPLDQGDFNAITHYEVFYGVPQHMPSGDVRLATYSLSFGDMPDARRAYLVYWSDQTQPRFLVGSPGDPLSEYLHRQFCDALDHSGE